MKTWTLRIRAKDRIIFEQIALGEKDVETRAATPRFAKIDKGDELLFICDTERLTKRVTSRRVFPSISALSKAISFKRIMPRVSSLEEMKTVYGSFPGYEEKIREHGLIALELE